MGRPADAAPYGEQFPILDCETHSTEATATHDSVIKAVGLSFGDTSGKISAQREIFGCWIPACNGRELVDKGDKSAPDDREGNFFRRKRPKKKKVGDAANQAGLTKDAAGNLEHKVRHRTRAQVRLSRQINDISTDVVEGATGYKAFRKLNDNGLPIKKVGRPFGWRKALHLKAAQKEKGRAGRPHADSMLETPVPTMMPPSPLIQARNSDKENATVAEKQQTNKESTARQTESFRWLPERNFIDNFFETSQTSLVDSGTTSSIQDERVAPVKYISLLKVFATYKLTELILLNLDVSTVLQAQRVNRVFEEVIKRSTKLQQKLFFKPLATHQTGQKVQWNPLFSMHAGGNSIKVLTTNPNPSIPESRRETWYRIKSPKTLGKYVTAEHVGSWRRMSLCQGFPRSECINVVLETEHSRMWCKNFRPNLTMGHLVYEWIRYHNIPIWVK